MKSLGYLVGLFLFLLATTAAAVDYTTEAEARDACQAAADSVNASLDSSNEPDLPWDVYCKRFLFSDWETATHGKMGWYRLWRPDLDTYYNTVDYYWQRCPAGTAYDATGSQCLPDEDGDGTPDEEECNAGEIARPYHGDSGYEQAYQPKSSLYCETNGCVAEVTRWDITENADGTFSIYGEMTYTGAECSGEGPFELEPVATGEECPTGYEWNGTTCVAVDGGTGGTGDSSGDGSTGDGTGDGGTGDSDSGDSGTGDGDGDGTGDDSGGDGTGDDGSGEAPAGPIIIGGGGGGQDSGDIGTDSGGTDGGTADGSDGDTTSGLYEGGGNYEFYTPGAEDLWTDADNETTARYPAGLTGIWEAKKDQLLSSAFINSIEESFGDLGTGGGQCPAFSLDFSMGSLGNYGTVAIEVDCWIWHAVGLIILTTAVFTARQILFGG